METGTDLVSSRRSQAHDQVNSVRIIQGTFKVMESTSDTSSLARLYSFPTSFEADDDEAVMRHDRHDNPDLVTIDVALLPTRPPQVATIPESYERTTLTAPT